ncbi:lariat debranching enzyme [Blyttiomyces sp. JEL0837]|nr:lariat debranching enzyme [Blyttiomyces sp. JEL0837]
MHIAIEGCCHGELDKIYASIKNLERKENLTVDLLIICGDFQSIRNYGDLEMMACPEKHRVLGNFHEYYSGKRQAPIPTIFIGGNHEASNYLWELFHGGWVCPNIYFLGFAGVIKFGGVRIAGLSGIYNSHHYELGFHEMLPFNNQDCRSIYHVRKYNVYRLAQIRQPIDIVLSHDWPRGVYNFGNSQRLLAHKKHLAEEVYSNTLGSYPAEFLLKRLRPNYWFSAHLHVKFAALVEHTGDRNQMPKEALPAPNAKTVENPDEIEISDEEDENNQGGEKTAGESTKNSNGNGEVGATAVDGTTTVTSTGAVAAPEEKEKQKAVIDAPAESQKAAEKAVSEKETPANKEKKPATDGKSKPSYTRFLSLDKCLPNRDFLQVIEVPSPADTPMEFSYDEEWLAIVKATYEFMSLSRDQKKLPPDEEIQSRIDTELAWVKQNFSQESLKIPANFKMTAMPHQPGHTYRNKVELSRPIQSPQTIKFCEMLGLKSNINMNNPIGNYVPPAPQPTTETAQASKSEETKTNPEKPDATSAQGTEGGELGNGEGQSDMEVHQQGGSDDVEKGDADESMGQGYVPQVTDATKMDQSENSEDEEDLNEILNRDVELSVEQAFGAMTDSTNHGIDFPEVEAGKE